MGAIIGTFMGIKTYCLRPEQYYENRRYYDTQDCCWLFMDKLLIVRYGKAIAKIDFIPYEIGIPSGYTELNDVNVDEYYPGLALKVKVKQVIKCAIEESITNKTGSQLMEELRGKTSNEQVCARPWGLEEHK